MKDLIMDGNEVRNCPSNVAKLNVFEYLKYFPSTFISPFNLFLSISKEFFPALFYFIISFCWILIYPITIIFIPIWDINKSKREVKKRRKL